MNYKYYILLIGAVIILLSPIKALQINNPQYRVDTLVPNETSPNIIHPGDDVDLWLKITNNNYDKEVKNLKITIKPHYPFEIRQVNPIKGTATISHLNIGESDIAYFKLHVNENAPSMDYRIDVHVMGTEYKEENGKTVEDEINFTKIYYLPVYGIAKFELKTDQNSTVINPSKTGILRIILENKGTGTAKYLTVELSGSEYLNVVGPTTFYLKSMKPGENEPIVAKIYATTKAEDGIYPITAKVSWIGEDGQEYHSTLPIDIKVVEPMYSSQAFLYLDSYKYNPDGSQITIGVANRGPTTMKHCVLKIDGITELNNNYIKYVGNLDEDDYDTVSYDVKGVLNKTIPITVQLTYFDEYHNEYHISKTFNITFTNNSEEKSNTMYYIVIGIIVFLIIIYYIYKRKKRKKLELEEDFEE